MVTCGSRCARGAVRRALYGYRYGYDRGQPVGSEAEVVCGETEVRRCGGAVGRRGGVAARQPGG